MSKYVKLGSDAEGAAVELDVNELVYSRMVVQGNSGGGKSWLLRLLCERVAAQVPVIVLDPEGEFASLREMHDLVLVGSEGEIAADTRSAALLARKLVELGVSAVIDLYELKPDDQRQYVRLFLESLVALPRELWRPVLVCIDEAHKFCPEKGTGDAQSTTAVISLMSVGRKRGFCGVLATQRFSKLHNDALAEAQNVFIGKTWLSADQKRAGEYLGVTGEERRDLRNLGKGEFFGFGPALRVPGVYRFRSDQVATTHPKPGQRAGLRPPKASVAIREIVRGLEDLPERAAEEARNLEEARTQVRELQRQLRAAEQQAKRGAASAGGEVKKIEVPVVRAAELKRIDAAIKRLDDVVKRAEALQQSQEVNARQFADLREAVADESRQLSAALARATQPTAPAVQPPPPMPPSRPVPLPAPPSKTAVLDGDLKITNPQQRILDAIRFFEAIGNPEPTNVQIGAVALLDATGGHFGNTIGPLSTAGLVVRGNGRTRLTDTGRALATVPESAATLAQYHDVLRRRVLKAKSASKRTVDVLNVIISRGGSPVTNEEIGREVGIDHTGGHFGNTIGPLSTLGLIRRDSGKNYPTEVLFPSGLS